MIDRFVGIYGRMPLMNLFKLWGVKDDPPTAGNRLVFLFPSRTITVAESEKTSVYGNSDYLVEELEQVV